MMDSELWKKVEAFDLDSPFSEYGFSTRLAKENEWTVNFTASAILEYKKFMVLAATSEFMISPSEIVDIVWHQHLVFTQSYTALCNILGRKIEHLPSTQNREELEKFKKAKERTKQYYKEVFGEQPPAFWAYADMYGPLGLDKAKFKLRTVLLVGVFVWLLMLVPAYFILKPFYVTLDSFYFLTGYLVLSICVFGVLEFYNRRWLEAVVDGWNKEAFIFNLSAMEVVYLKSKNIDDVIHGYVGYLIDEGRVEIEGHKKLRLREKYETKNPVEFVIAQAIDNKGDHGYNSLTRFLKLKPVITNVATAMDGFGKYIIKSRMFNRLFLLNCTVLGGLYMLGMVRLMTGVMRERPVGFLIILLGFLTSIIAIFLFRIGGLTNQVITDYYSQKVVKEIPDADIWGWRYFILGPAVLADAFMPMYNDAMGHTGGSGDGSSGSGSCGSSCGGGCGGGCGGCGGG